MNLFDKLTAGHNLERYPTTNGYDLAWCSELGIGFLPSRGYDYGEAYWQKYVEYTDNGIGFKLTYFRKRFVIDNLGALGDLCDVGIGSGQFVDAIKCKGYDINPFARKWLEEHDRFGDPWNHSFDSLSFWDVLEHIEDPSELLKRPKHVFLSVPIHKDIHACLASKHLRPDEHLWHFTEPGIKHFMRTFGFELVETSDEEIKIGREDIMSYFFTRINSSQL